MRRAVKLKLVSALSLSRELFVFLHFMRLWSCFHPECRSLDLNHSYQKSGSRLERCFDADDDDVEESDLFQMKLGFAKRKLFFSKETSWLRKYFGIISDCFALHSLNLITSHISNDDQDDDGLDEPYNFFICGIFLNHILLVRVKDALDDENLHRSWDTVPVAEDLVEVFRSQNIPQRCLCE